MAEPHPDAVFSWVGLRQLLYKAGEVNSIGLLHTQSHPDPHGGLAARCPPLGVSAWKPFMGHSLNDEAFHY